MRRFLVRFVVGGVLVIAGLFVLALSFDTYERDKPDELPGFYETTVQVPHRAAPVSIYIWYPAAQSGDAELIGQNGLFFGEHVIRDAAPLAEAAPVVLTSHGSGGNGKQIGWLARDLVARGMVVIATDHHGTTSGDSDPFQTVNVWERPQDLTAILDHVQAKAPQGLSIDENRIAALGFSLGGHSALSLAGLQVSKDQYISYCDANPLLLDCGWMLGAGVDFNTIDQAKYEQSNRDPRVKLAVAIDPALPAAATEDSLARYEVPTLLVNLGQELVPAIRADQLHEKMGGSDYHSIPGTHHFGFLMECAKLGEIIIGLAGEDNICSDKGYRPRAEIHQELKGIIGPFLEKGFSDVSG